MNRLCVKSRFDPFSCQISTVVSKKLPRASDQAIIIYVRVIVDEMDELQKQGGNLCYRLLFPQAEGGVNARLVFSSEVQKRDLKALDMTIKSYEANWAMPSEKEIIPFLEPIYVELFEMYGDDVLILENPLEKNVDRDKVCSIAKTLYSKILALKQEQAVGVLRWMFSQA